MQQIENKIESNLQRLAHELFHINESGKEFIRLFKLFSESIPVLPMYPEEIARHGGPEAYMGYRAGQKSFFFFIEMLVQNYQMKINQTSEVKHAD